MVETDEKLARKLPSTPLPPSPPPRRRKEKNEMVAMVLAIVADDIEPRRTPTGWLFHASSNNIFLAFS